MRKSAQHVTADRELLAEPGEMASHYLERGRELWQRVTEEAKTHPLRTAGWAASAGFVLGGGIFTPLTAKTLRAGLHVALRLAVLPALTRGLAQLAEQALDGSNGYRNNSDAEDKK